MTPAVKAAVVSYTYAHDLDGNLTSITEANLPVFNR
jgi:hypothetical protein